ncbi:hypothetical protein ACPV50_18625 [Vibrio astriarenae]
MMLVASLQEQQAVLRSYIHRAGGQTQRLMECLYQAYPNHAKQSVLMKQLGLSDVKTFRSLVRNAHLLIEVEKVRKPDGDWLYRIGGSELKRILAYRWVSKMMQ